MQVDIVTTRERRCKVVNGPAYPGLVPMKWAGVKCNSHLVSFSHLNSASDGLECWRSFLKV